MRDTEAENSAAWEEIQLTRVLFSCPGGFEMLSNYLNFWNLILYYFQFHFTVSRHFLPRVRDSPAEVKSASDKTGSVMIKLCHPCHEGGGASNLTPWCSSHNTHFLCNHLPHLGRMWIWEWSWKGTALPKDYALWMVTIEGGWVEEGRERSEVQIQNPSLSGLVITSSVIP